jgi:TonB-linked SusC/RagA family outer membrane protein
VNLNQSIGSRIEVSGSINASQVRSKSTPTAGQQNANAGAVSAAIQYAPVLPIRRADGSYSLINPDLNVYNSLLDAPQTPNPVSLTNDVTDSLSDTRLLAQVSAQAELLDNLDLKIALGTDYANRGRNTYYPRTTLRGLQSSGDAIRGGSTAASWLDENTLTYQRKFGTAHSINLLGGYSRQRTDFEGNSVENSNFVSDITGYNNIAAGTQAGGANVSSRRSAQTLESYLARANYSLLDKYLLTATIRRDGSSRFAENRKWGSFPSVAFAWRASQESFFANQKWIDELKFRVSTGTVGNPSIRPYQSLARLNNVGYSFNGTAVAGYYPTSVANPDLTWETTRERNVGLDFAFLDRFSFTADAYTKKTTDLLLQISLPYETGFESALANRGSVRNTGVELGLDANIIKGSSDHRAFAWRANVNFAHNNNEVLDLGGPTTIFADLLTSDYNLPGTMITVGKPIGEFYGFKGLGVIRDSAAAAKVTYKNFSNSSYKPGDMLAADLDGDGVITLADRTDIGSPIPKFTMGLTNVFTFRGVELSGLLQGVYGNKILNVNRIRTESSPRVNVSTERYLDAWSPTNLDAKFPKIGENPNQVGTNNFTDNLLEDGSYIRLRSLSVSFGLPAVLAAKTRLEGARVYATGNNLWTATHYTGFDPDVSSQSTGTTNRGIDIGAYPLSRSVTIGLNLNY